MTVARHDSARVVTQAMDTANGQGRTKEEATNSLAEAIALILEDRREDGLRGSAPDAERETVTVTIK